MARVIQAKVQAVVECRILLELDEQEAGALEAMFSYGPDAFLNGFYKQCGKAYVQPYEAGVRSLHDKIRGLMAGPLAEVKKTRSAIYRALNPTEQPEETAKPLKKTIKANPSKA